jgi:glycosyltransferase involved in cell wall biosynthesis
MQPLRREVQMRKRKVLVVSATPPPFSGPEVMTAQLLNSPLKDVYQLIHMNISKGRGADTKGRFDFTNILWGFLQLIQLVGYLTWYRPDIVYTNLAQNLAGFLRYASFILIVKLWRRPVIVRVMGDGFDHFYADSSFLLRFLIRFLLRRIDGFVIRANGLKKQFDGLVLPEKLHVVYSGIDVSEFNRPLTRASDSKVCVLFVGYLTQAKGALDLLAAVPMVVRKHPGVVFQLMGPMIEIERNITYINNPASNEAQLRSLLAQDLIADHVELLGVQSGRQKISAFVNADIFVLPSYSEAFPTVVLEAMAAGLPVIATPVGALPEVFDDRTIAYVYPGRIMDLAESIVRLALLLPEERRAIGERNRRIVQHHFDLQTHARRMGEVFECVYAMSNEGS